LLGGSATCDAVCQFTPIDPCNLDHARDVQLGTLAIDQGIRVPIRENGNAIAAADRNARLVARRPMLVRAEWVLDDPNGFQQRDIRAVLKLFYADGTLGSIEDVKATTARAESSYEELEEAYVWKLTAEQVQPGMRIAVELFEADPSFRNQPLPAVPPRFPLNEAETFELGVPDTNLMLEVVLVPFVHNLGAGCPPAPNITGMITRNNVTLPVEDQFAHGGGIG
jgi:hypothetical protein